MSLFQRFANRLIRQAVLREPDFIVGGTDNPYLMRWWITPWSSGSSAKPTLKKKFLDLLPGVYLHCFMRSDDDRALHDHPWANISILLHGQYAEHTIEAGGIHRRRVLTAGDFRIRLSGKFAHRVELIDSACWTLFITGPRYRDWGFHCPQYGWVHYKDFVAGDDPGAVGKGCDQ